MKLQHEVKANFALFMQQISASSYGVRTTVNVSPAARELRKNGPKEFLPILQEFTCDPEFLQFAMRDDNERFRRAWVCFIVSYLHDEHMASALSEKATLEECVLWLGVHAKRPELVC